MDPIDCRQLKQVGISTQINHISPMISFKPMTDDEPALVHSPLLKAALLTIGYIEANGPIGLTPSKALKRYFVQWAAEAFVWPNYTAEDLYAVNKVLNEADFPPLVVLHNVLRTAKLVRHDKGAMQLTPLAKKLKAKPAELWRLLASTLLFVIDHSQYTRNGDTLVGNWDIFLNVINVEAQNGVTEGWLCSVLFGVREEEIWRADYRLVAAFYIHVLQPLSWVGLLVEHKVGQGLTRRELFTKTPLWPAALALETDPDLQPLTRH
jgi:hypothetical protein